MRLGRGRGRLFPQEWTKIPGAFDLDAKSIVERRDFRGKWFIRAGWPLLAYPLLGGGMLVHANSWARRTGGGFVFFLLLLIPVLASGVTLEELRKDSHLTPEKFMSYFHDFQFKLGDVVQKPADFLAAQAGDCDDFASLAATVLREKGYTTRLVAVFMDKEVHVVCYVKEASVYLDYNYRTQPSPLVRTDGSLEDIAKKVARSFLDDWRSVSEFTYRDGATQFVMTDFN